MSNQCNWTENISNKVVKCENLSVIKDDDNVNERWFCKKHIEEVKIFRKIMHKNCINKEKIIEWLENIPNCWNKKLYYPDLIDMLKNGYFDYENN